MAYDDAILRTDAAALIPEPVANDLLTGIENQSAAMSLFTRLRMSSGTTRMPVLSALPQAFFVNGDTGRKQTTNVAWDNKMLTAEEIAVIVPIPEAVLDDAGFDVWGNIRPMLEQAVARTLDAAVFFGTNKPSSWPDDILTATTAAGNTGTRGTATVEEGGIAQDLNAVFATVEGDGYVVNGIAANPTYKGILRGARDAGGNLLRDVDGNTERIWGVPIVYPMAGQWPNSTTVGEQNAELFAGDYSKGIVAVRQDFTYKLLDQAVITDETGAIQFNLAQQDMVALRLVFRCGFQVANPVTYDAGTAGYPFAVLNSPVNA